MLLIREYEKYDQDASLVFFKNLNQQFEQTNYKYLKQDMIFIKKSDYDDIIEKIKIDPLNAECCNEKMELLKNEEIIINKVLSLVYTTKGNIQISDEELSVIIDSMESLTKEEKQMAKNLLLKDQSKHR